MCQTMGAARRLHPARCPAVCPAVTDKVGPVVTSFDVVEATIAQLRNTLWRNELTSETGMFEFGGGAEPQVARGRLRGRPAPCLRRGPGPTRRHHLMKKLRPGWSDMQYSDCTVGWTTLSE